MSKPIEPRLPADESGTLCFEGEFVAVFVDADTMASRSPPAEFLQAILAHRGEA